MSINIGKTRRTATDLVAAARKAAEKAAPKALETAKQVNVRSVSSFETPAAPPAAPKPAAPPPAAPKAKEPGFFGRIGAAFTSFVSGVGDAVTGVFKNVGESASTFFSGVGQFFTGHFSDGLKSMGMGIVKAFQTPVDALILTGGKLLSSIQTAIGVEPVGRKLTGTEIAELRKVYGDTIDYSKVVIKEGKSGVLSSSGRAFALGNTIYVPPGSLPVSQELLTHEMGHIWQGQNGGTDYLSEALYAQYFGDAYQWEKGIAEGKSWAQLDPEQQAQLISDAYGAGFFDKPNARFVVKGQDYTDYLNKALVELRARRGAP